MQVDRTGSAWQLALFASKNVKEPYDILESYFQQEVMQFEETNDRLSISAKQKAHDKVMNPRIERLKETITELYCREILSMYTEEKIGELALEVERYDCLKDLKHLGDALRLFMLESSILQQPLVGKEEVVNEVKDAIRLYHVL